MSLLEIAVFGAAVETVTSESISQVDAKGDVMMGFVVVRCRWLHNIDWEIEEIQGGAG